MKNDIIAVLHKIKMTQFPAGPGETLNPESNATIPAKEKPVFDVSEPAQEQETVIETKLDHAHDAAELRPQSTSGAQTIPVAASVRVPTDSEMTSLAREVDVVLEEGLGQIYETLSPEKQEKFQQQGRTLVKKIETAIQKSNLKLKQLLKWIRNWLKIIPHINRFFLEQELKIKSDKIMDIAGRERKERML